MLDWGGVRGGVPGVGTKFYFLTWVVLTLEQFIKSYNSGSYVWLLLPVFYFSIKNYDMLTIVNWGFSRSVDAGVN